MNTLQRIEQNGIGLAAMSGKLIVRAPEPLNQKQRAYLASHKLELIQQIVQRDRLLEAQTPVKPHRPYAYRLADGRTGVFIADKTLGEAQQHIEQVLGGTVAAIISGNGPA